MAVTVILNGVPYSIPEPGNDDWGQEVTDYLVAQASGLLQKAGGAFTLTAEVDFGATYGLKSTYLKSRTSNPASAGSLRLAKTDSVKWRNNANDADLALAINGSDQLTYNGTAIQPAGSFITALTGDVSASGPGSAAATVNAVGGATAANIASATTLALAATALNTASAIVKRDGSGNFTAGTITAALTGTASGNTTYTANNHGVVLSGSANVMTVIAPDSSTTKPLISGGASASPTWGTLGVAGGGTGQVSLTAHGMILGNGTSAVTVVAPDASTTKVWTSGGSSADPSWQPPSAPGAVPVGSILFWQGGYYSDGSNGSFTNVIGNTVANVNALLNGAGYYVCDGAALNDAGSSIFNGAGRHLPNLTDSRFIMGSTSAGSTGGENTNSHTHSVTSNVTVATQPTFTVDSHTHTEGSFGAQFNSANATTMIWKSISGMTSWGDDELFHVTGAGGDSGTNSTTGIKVAGTSATASVNTTTRTASVALTNNAVTSGTPSDTENRPLFLSGFFIMRSS